MSSVTNLAAPALPHLKGSVRYHLAVLEFTQRPLPRKEGLHGRVLLGLNSEASSQWERTGTSLGLAGELSFGAKYCTAVPGK